METQDNGFLKEIDGVRKEKERLTAAKLFSLTSWLLASSLFSLFFLSISGLYLLWTQLLMDFSSVEISTLQLFVFSFL